MSRVRAEALVLVNWKGVFYERYELDRHVTPLEGDNGAGKTSVMVAAYVVLLPDMTRLRFTNLGETGATGGDKGIWGRLGELGRPAYAALDEAGAEMFAAAIAAIRQRADEMSRRVHEAEERRRDAEAKAEAAALALGATNIAIRTAEDEKKAAALAAQQAEAWERGVAEALHWARALDERARALSDARARRDVAGDRRAEAERTLERATTAVGEASEARERAAAGLADLQKGLEELHRAAAAHQRATGRLADARRLLEQPDLDPDDAQRTERDVALALGQVDTERRALSRRLDDASAHRAEHAIALAALATVVDRPVAAEGAFEAARSALAEVGGWRDTASRRASLNAERRTAEAEARRQAGAQERASRLELSWEPGHGRDGVGAALSATETSLATLDDRARAADSAAAAADRELASRLAERRTLEARAARFGELAANGLRLSEAIGSAVADRAQLDAARATLMERRIAHRAGIADLSARREALVDEARQLMHAGGSFPADLLKLRDDLTAELLAAHFDEASLEDAAELEARLGPLAQALVVPDVEAATLRLRSRSAALPTVWLVAEDAALSLDPDGVVGERAHGDSSTSARRAASPVSPSAPRWVGRRANAGRRS